MEYEYNTIYKFDLTGQVSFGSLPAEQIYTLFRDGRVASKFLEHHIPVWFPKLKFVDADGYDHVHVDHAEIKLDLKGFTKGGASYVPSSMIGAGRSIDIVEAHLHANTIDYIFSDITCFPKVRIQFKRGTELVEKFPSGRIKPNQIDDLFNGVNIINEE